LPAPREKLLQSTTARGESVSAASPWDLDFGGATAAKLRRRGADEIAERE
jgi:hypothetical protein